MTLQAARFISDNQLEARAFALLRQYAVHTGKPIRPPVSVEKVIEQVMRIDIVWMPILDQGAPVLAKLVVRQSGCEIVVNENKLNFFGEHIGTEAYSLAHEAGHALLHVDKPSLQTESLAKYEQREIVLCRGGQDEADKREAKQGEWQAERFASFLLMPQDLVLAVCADLNIYDWPALYALKDLFGVTISALTHRLHDLHLITITLDSRVIPFQESTTCNQPTLWS